VRRRPYQVVLFDEVEKAHPDVFNILLQVLDDGRLTDGQGRVVDFRNTLIVMTSNLGSDVLVNMDEHASVETVRPLVLDVVRRHFRPEFLNRIDEMILFHRLDKVHMHDIVRIQLKGLEKLMADREMTLSIDDAALNYLAERGYDPAYGARPLKRVIQKLLVDGIARKILAGEFADGDVIAVGFDGENLTIGRPTVN
jgi:ATP-dependent Clp protease ATP-binding subunit ClpB